MAIRSCLWLSVMILAGEIQALGQQFGWTPQTSQASDSLNAVSVSPDGVGNAVGGSGSGWVLQASGTTAWLRTLFARDEQTAWAGGQSGFSFRTTDGGLHWTAHALPSGSNEIYDLFFRDANLGWAASFASVLKTTDGGLTWTRSSAGGWLYGITFVNGTTGWAVGSSGAIYKSTNGGSDWTKQTSNTSENLNSVHFFNTSEGWACGDNGTLLHTLDGGDAWSTVASNTGETLRDIHFVDSLHGWVAGANATVVRTVDGGATWMVQSHLGGSNFTLTSIRFQNDSIGYVVGTYGLIFRTMDGGTTWLPLNPGVSNHLWSVSCPDDQTAWVAGDGGTILRQGNSLLLHTGNGGALWNVGPGPAGVSLFGLDFIDPLRGWAVGTGGTVIATTDGGNSWTSQDSGSGLDLWAVDFSSPTVGYAATSNEIVRKTTDGGAHWTSLPAPPAIFSLRFADSSTGWAVGGDGLLARTLDGGSSWQTDFGTTSALNSVYFVNGLEGWAAGADGALFHTADGGTSWARQDSGTPETLWGLWFSDNLRGWAIGNRGTILKTGDGGGFWARQSAGTEDDLYAIAGLDAANLWIVGRNGRILRSSDESDSVPPDVQIAHPLGRPILGLSGLPLVVSGTASDSHGVEVKVDGERVAVDSGAFSLPVYPAPGTSAVPVEAADSAGNVQRISIPIRFDLETTPTTKQYYLLTDSSWANPYLSPDLSSTSYNYESVNPWAMEFPLTLDRCFNGNEFDYRLKLGCDSTATYELTLFLERSGRRTRLGSDAIRVTSRTYKFYSGTVPIRFAFGLPGQKLVLRIEVGPLAGITVGGGSGGSSVTLPFLTIEANGDADGNGQLNPVDLLAVAGVLAGLYPAGQGPCPYPEQADFDKSGALEATDLATLATRLAN